MTAPAKLRRARRVALVVALAAATAGCMSQQRFTTASVRPAPSQPVIRADLAPPPAADVPEAPISQEPLPDATGTIPGGTEVAVADPNALPAEPAAPQVARTDLLGGWTVASGGDSCQLFMSLTTWTGGYRASTRGCSSDELAGISAWDLSGATVTLKGGDGGAPVATLAATSPQQFAGSTASGAGITVSR
ncbi:AprI/Inh family metalloprotease inhibitor [Acuticoccus sp.]|uniref:AprI/Inh family metalloprotease inhibitor n=1 Tax=Acuticoccus sp. TaxID=1904378 RepID=UPI003B520EC5